MSLILEMTTGMGQLTDAYTIDKGYITLKADSFKNIGNIENDGIKTNTTTINESVRYFFDGIMKL